MSDWFEEYAELLEARLGSPEPGVHLSRRATNPVLGLARLVAHGTERKNAPLAAFVAGRYVAARVGQGADEADAVAEALEIAKQITPEVED